MSLEVEANLHASRSEATDLFGGSDGLRPNSSANKLADEDRAFHDWYRFVLSFPPHLVRQYFERFGLQSGQSVLDPFSGTGTTAVEAKLRGFKGVGIEANPMAWCAGTAKCSWNLSPQRLRAVAARCASAANSTIKNARKLRVLPADQMKLLLADSICPVPLHKALILRDQILEDFEGEYLNVALVIFAKTVVSGASNLHFGPEVGVKGRREDADVVGLWFAAVHQAACDLVSVQDADYQDSKIYLGDSREVTHNIANESIDAVFTSPPYPNEKDYSRTTRLESVLLGHYSDKASLRRIKKSLVRSNTRSVYKDDADDQWVRSNDRIQAIANQIESRRLELGKESGFEKLYARTTKLYFGGMAKHLHDLKRTLRPGAMLGYVVGDQASYLRVMIRTGQLLAEIADELGYEVCSIDLFRTRVATATRALMREEVLVLRWNG